MNETGNEIDDENLRLAKSVELTKQDLIVSLEIQ